MHIPPKTFAILTGPPLHGKTATGRWLRDRAGLNLIDIDAMRHHHFPNILAVGGVRDKSGDFFLEGDAEVSVACHFFATVAIEEELASGKPVLFTGATSRDAMKAPLHRLMQRLSADGYRCVVVKISGQLSDQEAEERIASRIAEGSDSPIVNAELYNKIREGQTSWPEDVDYYTYHEVPVGPTVQEQAERIREILCS